MLAQLGGHTHRVLTAVALGLGPRREQVLSRSRVRFAALGADDIQAYVSTGEPLGKAGAYGVQGRAAAFIAHIAGSYSGIMGLPLFETAQLLRRFQVRFNA
jgi:septum formation protein